MAHTIAVLYGGTSAERAISVESGKAVANALMRLQKKYEMIEVNADSKWIDHLRNLKPDTVFIALHGGSGEDGTVQAILDELKLPYNGSGVLASALAMDKAKAKVQFADAGLDVAQHKVFEASRLPTQAMDTGLNLPLVVKPNAEGSSVGISIVETPEDWTKAAKQAQSYGRPVMVEEFIPGRELTVAVMDNEPLAVTEIIAKKGRFYDYDSKYADGGSEHVVPADIPTDIYERAMQDALTAHKALGCHGATRVDFRWDTATNRLCVLELNTLPGMVDMSLLPEQAAYKGMSFEELVNKLVEDAQCAHNAVA